MPRCSTWARRAASIRHGPDLLSASGLAAAVAAGVGQPRLDGRDPRGLRLSLPAAEHRQRPRLGAAFAVRVRGQLDRRDRPQGRADPPGCGRRSGPCAGGAVRPGRAHLPCRGHLPHARGLEPLGLGSAEPRQGRHRAPDRRDRDRLVALYLHHELALHPAGSGDPLRSRRAVLLPVPDPARRSGRLQAQARAAVGRSGAGGPVHGLEPQP